MEKKKKILLISTLSVLIILLVIGIIYQRFYYKDSSVVEEENKIPEIKEDYSIVSYKALRTFNKSSVYYDETTKDIIETKDDSTSYYIGTYGKLYTTPILKSNDDEKEEYTYTCGNYSIVQNSSESNYNESIKYTITGQIIATYDRILRVMFKENGKECRYMIMINNNGIDDDGYNISDDFYIFDSTTGKTIRFDEDIISAFPESGEMSAQTDNGLYAYNNKTDIVVMTKDKKYGTTDYSANYKIEPKYDELYIAGKDLLVAKKDGKFGIINTKDETKLEFNYDGIEILDDYIIVIKGDKLGVLDRNYNVIVDFEIPYDDREEFDYELCCAESNAYYAEEDNNKNLILQTLSSSDYYYDGYATEEENDKYLYLYVIDKNGIKNRIKGYNNLYNKIDDIYNVVINKTSSIITFTLYDKNYNLQVMFSMTVTHPELIFHGYAEHINRDYYKLGIQYRDGDNYSEDAIYIDAENKEEVTLLDTQYYYFDNGYGYSTNNDKLTIYKNKDIIKEITEFKYYTYIGDYMFIAHNDYTEYLNRKIIKINFDK